MDPKFYTFKNSVIPRERGEGLRNIQNTGR